MTIAEEDKRYVLVIPDVHLKPWMFNDADDIMAAGKADMAVCLGDIPDDFGKQGIIEAYEETFERAVKFDSDHPDTLWCMGNHDLSYLYDYEESGYSVFARYAARRGVRRLMEQSGDRMAYMHRVNNCVFSHAGLRHDFAEEYLTEEELGDIDKAIARVNRLKPQAMWHDMSPIWMRPSEVSSKRMFMPKYLQVTGHTPVKEPTVCGPSVILDTYSTYRDGRPFGNRKMVIIDTVKKEMAYA